MGVRFLLGSGFAIEKETPYYAFSQILCSAAELSPSPTYGEILALRHNYDLTEEDLAALSVVLPTLKRADGEAEGASAAHHQANAAEVCLRIFSKIEDAVFVFEDAHWIDSQTWLLMQMLLQKLSLKSLVLIVTRPPTMDSQLRGGGNEGLGGVEEENFADYVQDDDRVKFSRILASLKEEDKVTLLALGPLNDDATKELVAATLETESSKVSQELFDLIKTRADGVPMYVRSLTSWLQEKKVVSRSDNGEVGLNADAGKLEFPKTLVATVLERFDALDEDSVRLLKICSCFGFEFKLSQLFIVAIKFMGGDNPESMTETCLKVLADRLMIVPVQESRTETHLKFTHQIIW